MKFNSIIRSIILEQGRYEHLKKTYTKPKKKGEKIIPAKMSEEQLDIIVLADPTTRRDGDNIKKAGTYTPWLLKQYLKLEPESEYGTPQFNEELSRLQELFFEDLYKTTMDLQKFDRFKSQIPQEDRDINKHTIDSLTDITADFSLEKTKASKEEKQEASKTYEHPGGEVIFRGSDWTVVKIEDQGQLGKDAACFYGGNHLESSKGETRWCTSSPGLNYFSNYIKKGPLYVVIPNTPTSFKSSGPETGEKSGLPAKRYQFHFPDSQFMDPDDRQIDLVKFLNDNPELKEVFKPEFMAGLTNKNGTEIAIKYPNDSSSKYIALYGFDDLFKNLPKNLESLVFENTGNNTFNIEIPKEIGNFQNLIALHLEGIVGKLPKEVGNLKNLQYFSLPNNPDLTEIPKEIANLKDLELINLRKSPNVKVPDEIENMDVMIFR